MPFYVYKCKSCQHLFEEFFPKIPNETPKVNCPECDSEDTVRDLGKEHSSFVLKGRGWAKDLYHAPKNSENSNE